MNCSHIKVKWAHLGPSHAGSDPSLRGGQNHNFCDSARMWHVVILLFWAHILRCTGEGVTPFLCCHTTFLRVIKNGHTRAKIQNSSQMQSALTLPLCLPTLLTFTSKLPTFIFIDQVPPSPYSHQDFWVGHCLHQVLSTTRLIPARS